jgi:lysophospholipase L1-like esterase
MKRVIRFRPGVCLPVYTMALAAFISAYLALPPHRAVAQRTCNGPLTGLWFIQAAAPAQFDCTFIECNGATCVCDVKQSESPIPEGYLVIEPIASGICHEGDSLSGEDAQPGYGYLSRFSGTVQASGRPGILDDLVDFAQTTQITVDGGGVTITWAYTVTATGTVVEPGLLGQPFGVVGDWQRYDEWGGNPCVSGPFQTCSGGGQFETLLIAPTLVYYGLGDSVAAGHGLNGESGDCKRAPGAYPNLVAELLAADPESPYDIAASRHLACSGATSGDLTGQVDSVLLDLSTQRQRDPATVALVSMTIGANDFPWTNPTLLGQLLCSASSEFPARVAGVTSAVSSNVQNEIQRLIAERDVYVVLTDYYNPFNARSHILRAFLVRKSPLYQQGCEESLSLEALYARTEFAIHSLNQAFGQVAAAFGTDRVRLASVHGAFHGRESPRPHCGTALPSPRDTWVQFPLANGTTGDDLCFHPNADGANAFATGVYGIAKQLLIHSLP